MVRNSVYCKNKENTSAVWTIIIIAIIVDGELETIIKITALSKSCLNEYIKKK